MNIRPTKEILIGYAIRIQYSSCSVEKPQHGRIGLFLSRVRKIDEQYLSGNALFLSLHVGLVATKESFTGKCRLITGP